MNNFLEIFKVEKPESSPPGSPVGIDFGTPKFLDCEEVERLSNENLELKNKIREMENEMKLLKLNHKIEMNSLKLYKNSDENAVDKYNDMVFESKIIPLTTKCKKLIEKVHESLNSSFKFKAVKDIIDSPEEDSEICEFYRESNTTSLIVEDMNSKLKSKDQQIRKHKNFIKTLKLSLEQILIEHQKSKELNKLQMKEIAELKKRVSDKLE